MLGFVYKIASPSTDLVYFGSTIQSLNMRFGEHKRSLTCSSKLLIQYTDCYIELIEEVEFQDIKELLLRERYYIENFTCVNKIIPLQTIKEYQKKHKEQIKEQKKEYREKNKEQIKEYREKHKEQQKEYYQKNKEQIKLKRQNKKSIA